MNQPRKTNLADLLGDLNCGIFEQQINTALSDIAANVVTHGKNGELTLKFKLKQIADSNQVTITHALKSTTPKPRGRIIEEIESDTPLYVGSGGKLSISPDNQVDFNFKDQAQATETE